MYTYEEIIDKIYNKNSNYDEMVKVNNIIVWLFDELDTKDHSLYIEAINKLEDILYEINDDEAIKIVKAMKPHGERWSKDIIKDFILSKNVSEDCLIKYYLVMNMAYNDYYNLAKIYDKHEDAEFYFELAKDFINDVDAKPHKVAKYFL